MMKAKLRSTVVGGRLLVNGSTQRELAEALGVSEAAVSLIMLGKRTVGRSLRARLLAHPLFADLSFEDLFIVEGGQRAA